LKAAPGPPAAACGSPRRQLGSLAQLRAETLARLQVEMLAAMAELDRDLAAGSGAAGPQAKPKAKRKPKAEIRRRR
jgi:hypothetical protein